MEGLFCITMVLIFICLQANMTYGQAGSLGFYLNGVAYPNGSTVLRTDIGESNAALQCTTDSITCCSNTPPEERNGEFYFPNGTTVPVLGRAIQGYYRDRGSQLIRLNRKPNGMISGQFHCEIPDINGTIINLFIQIVDVPLISLHIDSSGASVAGEIYSLECSVSSMNEYLTLTVIWQDSNNVETASPMFNTTGRISTLWFDPLMSSDSGTYVCTAIQGRNAQSKSVNVLVKNPNISAIVDEGEHVPMLGARYSFNCIIAGVDRLIDAFITYQWLKDGNQMLNQTTNFISYDYLSYLNVGLYTCQATISSLIISEPISVISDNPLEIVLILPEPTSVVITSYPSHPIKAGTEVTLTCTVLLNHTLAGIPPLAMGVTVVWIGPLGVLETGSDASATAEDPLVYTSVLHISSAVANESYTCQVSVDSMSSSLASSQVGIDYFTITTVDILLSIRVVSGSGRAGESYCLDCNAKILGSVDQTCTLSWLDSSFDEIITTSDGVRVVSDTIVNTDNSLSRILLFNPLAVSDARLFICQVTLQDMTETKHTTIIVRNPTINAYVTTEDGIHPNVGQSYHLYCTVVFNVASDNFNVTYRWKKDGVLQSAATPTLSFSTLRLSDAGQYDCEVTLSSIYLVESILATSNKLNLSLQIPSPGVTIFDDHYLPPYNGTIYSLTGVIHLDETIVNTNITATWVWSLGNETLETQSSLCCRISIQFRPLTTYSSGVYNLSVIVKSPNSDYIVESSGHTYYKLTVSPLPSIKPSISVDLQQPYPSDGCRQAVLVSCTNNVVENLFTLPTVSWIGPDGREVTPDARSNINPVIINQWADQLLFNGVSVEDRGVYRCRATVNIPEAFIENRFYETSAVARTELPGNVQQLNCVESTTSDNSIFIRWKEPAAVLDNEVISYRVVIKQLRHRDGTRQVVESPVQDFIINDLQVHITEGLVAEVPYSVSVTSLSLSGCGDGQQLYCFTREGQPPPPANVRVRQYNSTTVGVSWTKYTLVELKGLAHYVITYNIISSRKRVFGGAVTVPWKNSNTFITNLQPGALYAVAVRLSTSVGSSAQVEVYKKLIVDASEHSVSPPYYHHSDPVFLTATVCGVVMTVIVAVIAITIIVALVVVLKHRQVPTDQKENRRYSLAPSTIIMANESGSRQGLSDHNQETTSCVQQPNVSYQVIPLRILPTRSTEQPYQLTAAEGNGYTHCPLYETGRGSTEGQHVGEISFSENHFASFSDSSGQDTDEQEH